jgi:hypothetical protein
MEDLLLVVFIISLEKCPRRHKSQASMKLFLHRESLGSHQPTSQIAAGIPLSKAFPRIYPAFGYYIVEASSIIYTGLT